LLESTQSWSATAVDIDNNGTIDVVDSQGKIWLNDGTGNFTFKDHSWTNSLYWMNGTGVCAGDFLNNGHKQVVITDLNISAGMLPVSDTAIFELDNNLKPVSRNFLPVPILDRTNTSIEEISHDVKCRAVDMNNDGLLDVVVFSRPWASARNNQWTAEGQIQILINQGNLTFVDQTNLTGFATNIDIDYFPVIQDVNGDGIPDIWSSPQLLVSGNGTWTRRLYNQIPSQRIPRPIKVNGVWGFLYAIQINSNQNEIHFAKPTLTISY
jgi:FG-GAP-like repeat